MTEKAAILRFEEFSDEKLIERLGRHDATAEEFLLRKYKGLVAAKAQSYFIMGADRDDLIQEGMIGLLKAVRGYDAERGSSFRTFAEICIERQLKTAVKQAARKKHHPLNNSVSLNQTLPGEAASQTLAERLSENRQNNPETLAILKEMIDGIGRERQARFSKLENQVWQYYLTGKSNQEISRLVDKSPKSVENSLQRVKRKLRAMINSD
jgi:RNA polymerase sporulation-specific sigma factor